MKFGSGKVRLLGATIALATAAGVGAAAAATSSGPPSNGTMKGAGVDEFGLTKSFFHGHTVNFTYTKGFYCDTKVKSRASSGCEAGANFKKPPAKHFDPLYILVPLGFKTPAMKMECPSGLVCVDHPGTIDLRRLEPALKPLYPHTSKKALTKALSNYATPGHQHFITDKNGGKPEWWDVKVVGVTKKAEYNKINQHESASYLKQQVKKQKTTGIIPTNLFLYFGVK
jgi:hypothetical protein